MKSKIWKTLLQKMHFNTDRINTKSLGVCLIGHLHQRRNFSYSRFVSLAKYCLKRSISYFPSFNTIDTCITQQLMMFLPQLYGQTDSGLLLCGPCVWKSNTQAGIDDYFACILVQTVKFPAHLCKVKITSDLEVRFD